MDLDPAELAGIIGLNAEVDHSPAVVALFLCCDLVDGQLDTAAVFTAAMRAFDSLFDHHWMQPAYSESGSACRPPSSANTLKPRSFRLKVAAELRLPVL